MNTSRILELSAIIRDQTEAIHKHLAQNGLPFPTFKTNGSTGLPENLADAKDAVLDATSELHDLLMAPMDLIASQGNHNNMAILQAIARFSIAKKLPVGEKVSFASLSKTTGIKEATLKRLLRHAITMRIFEEPEKGLVGHTNLSKLLAEPVTHNWISAGSEEMWPAAPRTVDAISKWPETQEPNESGFSLANNTTNSVYQILSTDPVRAGRFADGMKAFTTSPGFDASHVLNNYDWEAIGNGTVVDVGGNRGHIAIPLATKFPKLKVIVQDMESVIKGAESEVPPEIAPRVQFMAHDFFTEQPIRGADVYYMRWIMHNWSDKYCILILRGLIPALKNGARILIHEMCLPEPGKGALWKERILRTMDLSMLGAFNGKERDCDDWQFLFKEADERFKFVGLKDSEGSALSFVEARWSE